MKENANLSSVSKIMNSMVLDGLSDDIQPESAETTQPRPGRKATGNAKKSISIIVDTELLEKVRTLSAKEEIGISEIFRTGASHIIKQYETKYGTLRPLRQNKKKKDLESLLDM